MSRPPITVLLAILTGACAPAPSVVPSAPHSSAVARVVDVTPAAADAGSSHDPEGPALVVTRDAIVLDGTVVADAALLDRGPGLQRIDALFDRLRRDERGAPSGVRAQWLDGREAGGLAGADTLVTAAFAGFTEAHLRTATGWLAVRVDVPTREDDSPLHRRLVLDLAPEGPRVAWHTDEPCASAPPNTRLAPRELEAYLTSLCGQRLTCVGAAWIWIDGAQPFQAAVDVVETVRRHGDARFAVVLFAHGAARPAVPGCKCGAPIHQAGSMPPGDIQKTVRAHAGEMHACYGAGLKRNPRMRGRVGTRFTIGTDGRVREASLIPSLDAGGDAIAPTVAECIRAAFTKLTFPSWDALEEVTIDYPYVFEP
jgi:hypothetical protein